MIFCIQANRHLSHSILKDTHFVEKTLQRWTEKGVIDTFHLK